MQASTNDEVGLLQTFSRDFDPRRAFTVPLRMAALTEKQIAGRDTPEPVSET